MPRRPVPSNTSAPPIPDAVDSTSALSATRSAVRTCRSKPGSVAPAPVTSRNPAILPARPGSRRREGGGYGTTANRHKEQGQWHMHWSSRMSPAPSRGHVHPHNGYYAGDSSRLTDRTPNPAPSLHRSVTADRTTPASGCTPAPWKSTRTPGRTLPDQPVAGPRLPAGSDTLHQPESRRAADAHLANLHRRTARKPEDPPLTSSRLVVLEGSGRRAIALLAAARPTRVRHRRCRFLVSAVLLPTFALAERTEAMPAGDFQARMMAGSPSDRAGGASPNVTADLGSGLSFDSSNRCQASRWRSTPHGDRPCYQAKGGVSFGPPLCAARTPLRGLPLSRAWLSVACRACRQAARVGQSCRPTRGSGHAAGRSTS